MSPPDSDSLHSGEMRQIRAIVRALSTFCPQAAVIRHLLFPRCLKVYIAGTMPSLTPDQGCSWESVAQKGATEVLQEG